MVQFQSLLLCSSSVAGGAIGNLCGRSSSVMDAVLNTVVKIYHYLQSDVVYVQVGNSQDRMLYT